MTVTRPKVYHYVIRYFQCVKFNISQLYTVTDVLLVTRANFNTCSGMLY